MEEQMSAIRVNQYLQTHYFSHPPKISYCFHTHKYSTYYSITYIKRVYRQHRQISSCSSQNSCNQRRHFEIQKQILKMNRALLTKYFVLPCAGMTPVPQFCVHYCIIAGFRYVLYICNFHKLYYWFQ